MPVKFSRQRQPLRRLRWPLVSLAAAALASYSSALGSRADWIFEVEVPVATAEAGDTRASARPALEQVLQRVTGLAEIPESKAVSDARRNIGDYYSKTSYVNRGAAGGRAELQRILAIEFDKSAILELVRTAQLPIWTAKRPDIMVWIVVNEERGRRLADSIEYPALVRAIKERSVSRGLSIVLPMGDLLDYEWGVPELVRSRMWHSVMRASERYGVAAIAVIELEQSGAAGACTGNGVIWLAGDLQEFELSGETGAHCGFHVADSLAEQLVARYAVASNEVNQIEIEVSGVGTPLAYSRVLDYLRHWEFIDRVAVARARADTFLIRVGSLAPAGQLERLLTEEGLLRSTRIGDVSEGGEALRMHWLGAR